MHFIRRKKLYTFTSHISDSRGTNIHLRRGFWRVFENRTSPLRTELINLSTSSEVISPSNAANFPFRGLYATSSLSTDLNPVLSSAVRNAGCFVASNRLYEIASRVPKAEFCLLVSVFWDTCKQKLCSMCEISNHNTS